MAVPITIPGSLVEAATADARTANCFLDASLVQFGDPEIEHFHNSVSSHNHIVGLDVTMNNSARMRRREGVGYLDCNVDSGGDLKPALEQPFGKGLALDELGSDKMQPIIGLPEFMNGQNIGMIER